MTSETSPSVTGAEPARADGSEADVVVERDGATVVITINRPRARNAVDASVARGLATAMDALDADPGIAVAILTGAGGYFSAGMDLKAFARGENMRVGDRGFGGFTRRPPETPIIAAVEGPALAGGCELVLACDLVVASEEATFGLPEVKRGLAAAAGGLIRLPRRVPVAVAMELALTGDPLPATEAHRWGMVNHLTPAGGALAGARELAARIAAGGPLAVRASKQVIAGAPDWNAETMWERQDEVLGPVLASDDAREGARAFAEKRPPRWTGR